MTTSSAPKQEDGAWAEIVCRVSTQAQASEDAVSYETQEENCRRWCEEHGFQVKRVRCEAKSADPGLDWNERRLRPEFWAAWDALLAGEVQAMVFNDRTRVVRESSSYAYFLELSRKYGRGIIVVDSAYENLRDDWQRKALTALDGLASEADNKSRKLVFREKKVYRFRLGQLAEGDYPYGYRWRKEDHRFEAVYDQARAIRLIFSLYAGGDASFRDIVFELGQAGIPTATGAREWNPTVVGDILRRECYASGVYHHRYGGETYAIPCPPIVDRSTFGRVQAIADKRRSYKGPRLKSKALLSGRIFCGACTDPQGRPLPYYACSGYLCRRGRSRKRGGGCPNPYVPKSAERAVWEAVVAVITDHQSFKQAAEKRLAELEQDIARLQGAVGNLDAQITQVRAQIRRAVDAFIDKGYAQEQAQKRVAALEDELRRLEERKQEVAEEEEELHQLQLNADWLREVVQRGYSVIEGISELEDGGIQVKQRSGYFRMVRERRLLASGRREEQTWTKARLLEALSVRVTVHEDRLEITGTVPFGEGGVVPLTALRWGRRLSGCGGPPGCG